MKQDFDFANAEELALPDAPPVEEDIVSGTGIVPPAEYELLEEVKALEEDEIHAVVENEHEEWTRAIRHLNERVAELEDRLAAMEEKLKNK